MVRLRHARWFLDVGVGMSLVTGVLHYFGHPDAVPAAVIAVLAFLVAMVLVVVVESQGRRQEYLYKRDPVE